MPVFILLSATAGILESFDTWQGNAANPPAGQGLGLTEGHRGGNIPCQGADGGQLVCLVMMCNLE